GKATTTRVPCLPLEKKRGLRPTPRGSWHFWRRKRKAWGRVGARLARTSARTVAVIVSLHVATGAAAGAASGSRVVALLLGPILHLAGDRLPHQDIGSRRFEIGSGLAGLVLLAARPRPARSGDDRRRGELRTRPRARPALL